MEVSLQILSYHRKLKSLSGGLWVKQFVGFTAIRWGFQSIPISLTFWPHPRPTPAPYIKLPRFVPKWHLLDLCNHVILNPKAIFRLSHKEFSHALCTNKGLFGPDCLKYSAKLHPCLHHTLLQIGATFWPKEQGKPVLVQNHDDFICASVSFMKYGLRSKDYPTIGCQAPVDSLKEEKRHHARICLRVNESSGSSVERWDPYP